MVALWAGGAPGTRALTLLLPVSALLCLTTSAVETSWWQLPAAQGDEHERTGRSHGESLAQRAGLAPRASHGLSRSSPQSRFLPAPRWTEIGVRTFFGPLSFHSSSGRYALGGPWTTLHLHCSPCVTTRRLWFSLPLALFLQNASAFTPLHRPFQTPLCPYQHPSSSSMPRTKNGPPHVSNNNRTTVYSEPVFPVVMGLEEDP